MKIGGLRKNNFSFFHSPPFLRFRGKEVPVALQNIPAEVAKDRFFVYTVGSRKPGTVALSEKFGKLPVLPVVGCVFHAGALSEKKTNYQTGIQSDMSSMQECCL